MQRTNNPIQDIARALVSYRNRPVHFVKDIIGVTPDPWQAEALQALADGKNVAIRSGNGVGKSALLSWAIIWFLTTRPYPKVPATAPTLHQLKDVLWSEVSYWINRSKVKDILVWSAERVGMVGSEQSWFAVARTTTKPEELQAISVQIADANQKQGTIVPRAQDAWYRMYGSMQEADKTQKEATTGILEKLQLSLTGIKGERATRLLGIDQEAKQARKEIWETIADPKVKGAALAALDTNTSYRKSRIGSASFSSADAIWQRATLAGYDAPSVEKVQVDQLAALKRIESLLAADVTANQKTAGGIGSVNTYAE